MPRERFAASRYWGLSRQCFCVEAHKSATSGFWDFKHLRLLIRCPTSTKKDQPPTTEMVFLEAIVSLRDSFANAAARDGRIAKLKSRIAQDMSTNPPTPEEARKLRGGLVAYTSLRSGKLGRGMTFPLIRSQYKPRAFQLSDAMRRNIDWRYSAIGNLPHRQTP